MNADAPAPEDAPLAPMRRKWRRPLLLLAALLYLALLFGKAQFQGAGLVERDGYFHARYAQLFLQRGLSRSFPWTQASTWKDTFCDKEFLFHVLMVPFAQDAADPLRGVRWFILSLDLAVFALLFWVLCAHRVRWPLFFTLLLACMGGPFLIRLAMIRAHVLSILLALLAIHFLLDRRWKALAVLGFVYAWSYSVPLVLVLLAAPFVAGRYLAGGGLDWRSPLAALGGVVAGLLIHPYTPYTLETFLTYLDVVWMGFQGIHSAHLELGKEIYPYSTRSFLLAYPLLNLLLAGLCVAGWSRKEKLRPGTLGALCCALFWVGMTLAFSRFAEYAMPLTVLAVALVTRDVLAEVDVRRRLMTPHPLAAAALAGGLVLLAGGFHVYSVRHFLAVRERAAPRRFRKASAWMATHLPPGQTVVNLWWDDFPELFYDGYRQRYLCGLDPTYMWRYDRKKAELLEAVRTRRAPLDGHKLARVFGSRYLILRTSVAGSYPELTSRRWGYVYKDKQAVIYALRGKEGPPAHSSSPPPPGPSARAP